jgi:hypothetical protein
MKERKEWTTQEREEEKMLFGRLSPGQRRYVLEWISGEHQSRSECYAKAFKREPDRSKKALASMAQRTHTNEKVQAAIAFLTHRHNKEALLTMEEKRAYLAGIVRAHSPLGRKLNPSDPLRAYPLLEAIKLDNLMSGDQDPEGSQKISIGVILSNLESSPIVPERPQKALPIPNASGGFGRLPGAQALLDPVRGDEDGDCESPVNVPMTGPFAP